MTNKKLRNIFIAIICFFAMFSIVFYFVLGDRIEYKESNNGVIMANADNTTIELHKGNIIDQKFINRLDKIEKVGIVCHTYWRDNSGTLTIQILKDRNVYASQKINVADIPDQHRIFLELNKPLENKKDEELTLRVYTDSPEGQGICLMSCSTGKVGELLINGEKIEGEICFETNGKEEVRAGAYYWPIMGTLGITLIIALVLSYFVFSKGKSNHLLAGISAINKYKFLISQLVTRDFKSKYKRSILGILWSFLNPLLTMIVQFLVFSTIFKADTKSYPVYLLSGVICFSFFKEATDMCLTSISGNSNLINKVYVPKYIFPLAKTISSLINLGLSLIPLLLVTLIMGIRLKLVSIMSIYFLLCLAVFSLGVGLFLAALMVFFRDIQFLWNVITQIWQYATPIFYSSEIIPDKFRFILVVNPLYHFIGNLRKCLMDGISPDVSAYIYCLLFALISLSIGSFVFKKTQDKFTLFL